MVRQLARSIGGVYVYGADLRACTELGVEGGITPARGIATLCGLHVDHLEPEAAQHVRRKGCRPQRTKIDDASRGARVPGCRGGDPPRDLGLWCLAPPPRRPGEPPGRAAGRGRRGHDWEMCVVAG